MKKEKHSHYIILFMSCQVQTLFNLVKINYTNRYDCPKCLKHNTLSITNTGSAFIYRCFHADCILRGHVKYVPDTEETLRRLSNRGYRQSKSFVVPDYWIHGIGSKRCIKMLLKYHCLKPYQEGLISTAYDPREDRLVFLIKEGSKTIGAVGRTLSNQTPKTKNYHEAHTKPFIVGKGHNLVIVEDCLSAIAICNIKTCSGMALLGTNMIEEYVKYIKEYNQVFIALDKDARKKALDIAAYLRYYHSKVNIIFLNRDIKDMEVNEMLELFNGVS